MPNFSLFSDINHSPLGTAIDERAKDRSKSEPAGSGA